MSGVVRFAALLALIAGFGARGSAQSSDESDVYAWLQYGRDGLPHLRVIPSDRGVCPAATADGRGVTLALRISAAAGFDRVLCDAALPAMSRTVRVGERAMPAIPQRIARFVVLGDTGCRNAGNDAQDCRDNAAWPFARIARSIAALYPRPDLIVHTGNVVYREPPCPAGGDDCASASADTWTAWSVDLFEPGAGLFATAPILWTRGARDDCAHAGIGWSRYLAPVPQDGCRGNDETVVVSVGDVRFVDIDSTAGDTFTHDSVAFAFADDAQTARSNGTTFAVVNRAPRAAAATAGSGIAAIVAGQPRVFAVVPPGAGGPPTIVVGTGGDAPANGELSQLRTAPGATAEARFGFVVFDRVAGGWSVSERDPDGSEHRRCELHAHAVHCS